MLLVGGWQAWLWWLRNEPLGVAAQKIRDAFERQDAGTLWYYSHPQEAAEYGLDRRRFEEFYRRYVWPEASSWKRGSVTPGPSTADILEFNQFYTRAGRRALLSFVVFKTPDGPKTNVVWPSVYFVFDAKHGGRYDGYVGSERVFRVRLAGMKAEAGTLESLGIRGLVEGPAGSKLDRWERLVRQLEKWEAGIPLVPPAE